MRHGKEKMRADLVVTKHAGEPRHMPFAGGGEKEDNGRVRVVARVRPLHQEEKPRGNRPAMAVDCSPGERSLEIDVAGVVSAFSFDAVLGPAASQEDVFDRSGVRPLVESALDGYNCTVFAYGQTGSGKTHTITGPDAEAGPAVPSADSALIQRSIRHIFAKAAADASHKYRFAASYLEIYNETVSDLTRHSAALAVRFNGDSGFYVDKLDVLACTTEDDVLAILEEGLRRRKTASHEMNERSSRSHTILTVYMERRGGGDVDPDDPTALKVQGAVNFVDLAGSERVKDTKADGAVLQQSNQINKSLLALGNCISALGDAKKKHGHIPYRDSVLTMLLKDSLGGRNRTLMIACVSPSHRNAQESANTMRYASRAKRIQNKPVIRTDPHTELVLALRRQISTLSAENAALHRQVSLRGRRGLRGGHGGEVDNVDDDDEDISELAAITHEMLQTKQLLQKVLHENDELYRQQRDVERAREKIATRFHQAMKENERLLTKIRESPQPGTAISRVSAPLTAHELEVHEKRQAVRKQIDRDDVELPELHPQHHPPSTSAIRRGASGRVTAGSRASAPYSEPAQPTQPLLPPKKGRVRSYSDAAATPRKARERGGKGAARVPVATSARPRGKYNTAVPTAAGGKVAPQRTGHVPPRTGRTSVPLPAIPKGGGRGSTRRPKKVGQDGAAAAPPHPAATAESVQGDGEDSAATLERDADGLSWHVPDMPTKVAAAAGPPTRTAAGPAARGALHRRPNGGDPTRPHGNAAVRDHGNARAGRGPAKKTSPKQPPSHRASGRARGHGHGHGHRAGPKPAPVAGRTGGKVAKGAHRGRAPPRDRGRAIEDMDLDQLDDEINRMQAELSHIE
mmetsp:Transcript_28263/g.84560  ORF Transcript_28263/g.84560 Transcript_28263/m.84560 type:complete len:859 (-) Transcript_28263:617-3193(-)